MKKIIAILGLPGSGKTETVQYIIQKYQWPKVYFGEVTFDEMKRRGLEMNQANEKIVREDLRDKFGMRHYSGKVIEKINAMDSSIVLAESLYGWDEYLHFKEEFGENFYTIAVCASPKVRYERLHNRINERPLEPEEAQKRDYAQIENLKQAGPIAMADYLIINEGNVDELHQKIDEIINRINSK